MLRVRKRPFATYTCGSIVRMRVKNAEEDAHGRQTRSNADDHAEKTTDKM